MSYPGPDAADAVLDDFETGARTQSGYAERSFASISSLPTNNSTVNRVAAEDQRFHNWYRFVLSFPPHLVKAYLDKFDIDTTKAVLDPFCGTGTTVVEAKLLGLSSIGIEANPMAHFASATKLIWSASPKALTDSAAAVAQKAQRSLSHMRHLRGFDAEQTKLLLTDSICTMPLHMLLVLRDAITASAEGDLRNLMLLALAKTAVQDASNLHFGPEVGVRGRKENAPVVESWMANVVKMAADLATVVNTREPKSLAIHGDSRSIQSNIKPGAISAVFTSPPYPNEKDYTRTTRLESVLLGFINNRADLKALKQGLLRSNTRNVYKVDDDDTLVQSFGSIQTIATEIERRRIEMGKTSGFEKLYARVTKLYFGGMLRQLRSLQPYLTPGAHLGYVVGDQASFLRVFIPTGQILAEIAESLGYKVVALDLFRTRLATATRAQLREEVLVLKWLG
jgi:hypothetical protein